MTASRPPVPEPVGLIGRTAVVDRIVSSVASGPGIVVSGPRGRGCTSVLDEAGRRLLADGRALHVLDAASPDRSFGALRRILGPDLPDDVEAATLARVGEVVTSHGSAEDPVVLVVDDLDAVDAATAIVLHQLTSSARAAVLAAVREGPGRGADPAWWVGTVPVLELAPLDRRASDELVERLVGGPVDAGTRARLWDLARGHPGWLVAAVDATVAAGQVTRTAGIWSVEGDLAATVDPEVLAQVDALPADVRAVLRTLALADELTIDDAERIGGSGPLAEAERRGLVRVDEGADGVLWCATATRLVAAALGATTDGAGERAMWARLAEVLAESESTAHETALVRGRALVRAGRAEPPVGEEDASALLRAAEAAQMLSRWDDCAALARPAWRGGAGPEAFRLLTIALGFLGDHAAIAALTDDIAALPADDVLVSHAEAVAVSQFHSNDPEQAWATAEAARGIAPHLRSEVDVFESQLRAFRGEHDRARALAEPWVDDDDMGVAVSARTVLASIDMNRGCTADAIAAFDAIFAFAMAGPEAPLSLVGTSYLFRLGTVADAGRIEEAIRDATVVEPLIVNQGDPASHGWLALHLGRCHLRAGRPRTAARWFGEAVSDLRRVHRPGWLAHPAAGLVAAHAAAGDLPAAREAHRAWSEIPPHAVRIFRPEELRYVAWLDAAEGRADEAVAGAAEAVRLARDVGTAPYEAAALHDLARLGAPVVREEAAEGLARLAATGDSPLVAAHAARARAIGDGDAAALAAIAAAYTSMGAQLDAMEAWAEVVRIGGDDRTSAQALRHLAELRTAAEGLVTPLLEGTGAHPTLTDRETEIAAMAVAGSSRQEIADALVVSVRTIDSHLQRVYRKLGVRNRTELVEAMGGSAVAPPP